MAKLKTAKKTRPQKKQVPLATKQQTPKDQNTDPKTIVQKEAITGSTSKNSQEIPTVNVNSQLEIDKAKKPESTVPEVQLNAPLKIEEAPTFDAAVPLEKHNRKLFAFGIFVTLLIISLTATASYFLINDKFQEKTTIQNLEIKQEDRAPKTQTTTFNKSAWTLEILNGSQIAGSAGNIAQKLENLGFKVLKIGNADNKNYQSTQIYIQDSLKDQTPAFLKEISTVVKNATSAASLKDSTAAARIIIGKN